MFNKINTAGLQAHKYNVFLFYFYIYIYTCYSCRTLTRLQYELVYFQNKKPMFACSKCGFMSVFKDRYTEHVRTAHADNTEARYTCEDCGKGFTSNSGFLQHRQRHHGVVTSLGTAPTTHNCTECGKVFYSSTHLKRHMTVHSSKFTCMSLLVWLPAVLGV